MTKDKDISNPAEVSAHITKLPPDIIPIIEYIRKTILATDPVIGERIKWNNPSFFYTGELPPFDPKTYKRELIVMNLHKGRVMLVFPSGAKVNDTTGFLEGDYKDGRRTVVFKDLADVQARKEQLQTVIKVWLSKIND